MPDEEQEERLIRGFELKLVSPACHPGAEQWSAEAHLDVDIGETLPYLNARFAGASYEHDMKVLVVGTKGRKYAFRPRRISAAPVANREEATEVLREMTDLVNETWQKRAEITPSTVRKVLPTVLELYRHLPRTNCGDCGSATCMAFAAALRNGQVDLDRCPPLQVKQWAADRQALLQRLGALG
jgi:ArsR family metal-binding transcriptional regulator